MSMGMEYNIYCDESCHLERDQSNQMVFGCIWIPKHAVASVSQELKAIKLKHGYPWEIKWKRVSYSKVRMYEDIVNYFWGCSHINFRGVLVTDKSRLDHKFFNCGSHDAFYYKMFYQAFYTILRSEDSYNIYLDRKDSQSNQRVHLLTEILRRRYRDYDSLMIRRVQQIRSHESNLIQVCDLLIGALSYAARGLHSNRGKNELVRKVITERGIRLDQNSSPNEEKFNLFLFEPKSAI